VTKPVREGLLMQALEHIQQEAFAREGTVHLRVAQFDD